MSRQNVALTKCFYCGGDDRILLATRYRSDGSPVQDLGHAHGAVIDMEPCNKCRELMGLGVIFLTIDEKKSPPGWNSERIPSPFRTGGFFVVKDDAVRRIINATSLADWAIQHRWMFIEHEVAERLGFFRMAEQQAQSAGKESGE